MYNGTVQIAWAHSMYDVAWIASLLPQSAGAPPVASLLGPARSSPAEVFFKPFAKLSSPPAEEPRIFIQLDYFYVSPKLIKMASLAAQVHVPFLTRALYHGGLFTGWDTTQCACCR